MKIKVDKYDLGIIIDGLFNCRECYAEDTNTTIDDITLRLIKEHTEMNTSRKRRIVVDANELSLIRKCLLEWRNDELQKGNDMVVEYIGEVIILL